MKMKKKMNKSTYGKDQIEYSAIIASFVCACACVCCGKRNRAAIHWKAQQHGSQCQKVNSGVCLRNGKEDDDDDENGKNNIN